MRAAKFKPRRQTIPFLGREVPVSASAKSEQSHIAREYGDCLAEVRAAMQRAPATLPAADATRTKQKTAGLPGYRCDADREGGGTVEGHG